MSQRTQQRGSHRRRFTRRRTIGALIATAATGTAVATGAVLTSPASAAVTWPTAKGTTPVSSTIEVSGTYDGGMKRFHGSGKLGGDGQDEGQDPIFKLKDGAVLKNVILGAPAADGVHCMGSCTLRNVWWEDVGEDAATFKGTSSSARYTVTGGGARKASDKVFQFNGAGTLTVTNFDVSDFGKLVRACGNCKKQYTRHVVVDGVTVTAPGKSLVGINGNHGDTATLRNVTITGDSKKKITPCEVYKGNDTGKEPTRIGSGPDGKHCRYSGSDITHK
ncbi:pectate lyase [Streptomyces megasporus]|uniref:pectate lyase n=1 Tax=Streptomyces megasporus TaxID=44060 RepID=UPI0004E2092E|nr:pectate lyase [Streptomyces megasporus]